MKRIIEISEEDYNHLCFLHEDDIYKIVENSTPLNECETEECIPRKQTLEAIRTQDMFGYTEKGNLIPMREHYSDYPYVPYVHLEDVEKCISLMPSVYPKSDKPSGKWINDSCSDENGEPLYVGYHCSECRHKVTGNGIFVTSKYCPNCGAKMEQGENT